jgi:hypothetical protein
MHPHQLRHAFATSWLAEGGNENELMLVAHCAYLCVHMPLDRARGDCQPSQEASENASLSVVMGLATHPGA